MSCLVLSSLFTTSEILTFTQPYPSLPSLTKQNPEACLINTHLLVNIFVLLRKEEEHRAHGLVVGEGPSSLTIPGVQSRNTYGKFPGLTVNSFHPSQQFLENWEIQLKEGSLKEKAAQIEDN